jgi:hypothetical protein
MPLLWGSDGGLPHTVQNKSLVDHLSPPCRCPPHTTRTVLGYISPTVVSPASQAQSRRSARLDPRASATPPASHPRTSWHCQGSALHGTSSGCPTEPSPTRSSSPRAQTRLRHPLQNLPLCHLGMLGKVWDWEELCGSLLRAGSLTSFEGRIQGIFEWQRLERIFRDSMKWGPCHLPGTSQRAGSILGTVHVLPCVSLTAVLWNVCFWAHFTEAETKAQRDRMTCPMSHSH